MTVLVAPLLLAAEGGEEIFASVLAQACALLVAAAAIGYVCTRLRIVPIAGFLVAGILIGPNALRLVSDEQVVDMVAEIGIVLLLFTIGIEFSLERLNRIRRYVLIGGGTKVVLSVGVTTLLLVAFGVGVREAVFTAFLVSISSTAIVLKVLADRGEVTSGHGQLGLALLIFEDLAAVLMVLLIPVLAGGGAATELVRVLATAALIIAFVLVVARRVMPRLLEVIARACSPEVFLLSIVALCFGFAFLTNLAGVSVSLGAFLAGLLVSESRHSDHALGEILPLQILFSAAFFLSIGMLLDLEFLLSEPLLVLAAIALGLGVPLVTSFAAAKAAGVGTATAITAAFLLAQISEFAFVIERAGAEEGLSPAGLGEAGAQAFIAATVLLMLATPAMAGLGRRLAVRRTQRRAGRAARQAPLEASDDAGPTVLISGWGAGARHVAGELRAAGYGVRVVTLNPDGAAEAEAQGYDVRLGDSTKQHVLHAAGVSDADMVIVADDEPEHARRISAIASQLVPETPIAVRSPGETQLEEFVAAGVTHLVSAERSSAVKLSTTVLSHLRGQPLRTVVDMARIVFYRVAPEAACPHTEAIRPVLPSSYGCEDCLRTGDEWVHLRICLQCGYVGCCDSSPNRHARRHADNEQHPVITSAEPDEDWAYCFVDDVAIPPAESLPQPV